MPPRCGRHLLRSGAWHPEESPGGSGKARRVGSWDHSGTRGPLGPNTDADVCATSFKTPPPLSLSEGTVSEEVTVKTCSGVCKASGEQEAK